MAHGEQSDLLSHSSMHCTPGMQAVFSSYRNLEHIRIQQMRHISSVPGLNDAIIDWTCQKDMLMLVAAHSHA